MTVSGSEPPHNREMPQILDETGEFEQQDLQELGRFVLEDLLSTEEDISWLKSIRICKDDPHWNYKGYWQADLRFDSKKIVNIVAEIVLNYFYVKGFPRKQRLREIKKTLAHEYGHHWPLSYLLVNGQLTNIWEERLPEVYYQLRKLDPQSCACDYSQGWSRCDKEILAEDYRVLFAPAPYNEHHRMVMSNPGTLRFPDEAIKHYIKGLSNFSKHST